MKSTNRNSCPEEWMIQAYIDGELDSKEFTDVKSHIASCEACQNRVLLRKEKIRAALENFDQPSLKKREPTNNRKLNFAAWSSIAASIVVTISVGIWFILANSQKNESPNCEWVVLSEDEFNPMFESPNKLYHNRVIEIKEIRSDGTETFTYRVLKCDD